MRIPCQAVLYVDAENKDEANKYAEENYGRARWWNSMDCPDEVTFYVEKDK